MLELPGLGHPLMPPWTVTDSGPDGVTMTGHFTRSHVGGNNAVHGGMIPLFYDWLFGMVVTTAGIRPTRTAYLHVDYRKITPIDEPLTAHGRITDDRRQEGFHRRYHDGRRWDAAQRSQRPDGPFASAPAVRGTDVRHRNTIHGSRRRRRPSRPRSATASC